MVRISAIEGRSPRTRGSLALSRQVLPDDGSIPAYAGKPHRHAAAPVEARVDPRVRGEAGSTRTRRNRRCGRSPRTRGSHLGVVAGRTQVGSIPAYAGKPEESTKARHARAVDPRVRGEAARRRCASRSASGRSPRTRGSPAHQFALQVLGGSIPAYAGKPWAPQRRRGRPEVDPRVRGEAAPMQGFRVAGGGRSPRTRGSRNRSVTHRGSERSIPAYAGKPQPTLRTGAEQGVDPRVRGEAFRMAMILRTTPGRSPRTRGSHAKSEPVDLAERSIPAYAGKPIRRCPGGGCARVDPRVRGEALP